MTTSRKQRIIYNHGHSVKDNSDDKKEVEIKFEDNSDDDDTESSLGEVKYSHGNMSINVVDARTFARATRTWTFNREINTDHTAKLKKELLESKDPHFMGSLKVVAQRNSNPLIFRMIDGQHRCAAIREIFATNVHFNMDLIIEVYYVNDIDGSESWELFKKANNVLNVEEKDKTKSGASTVVENLKKKFPKAIYEPKGEKGRVNYPYIDSNNLFLRLKKSKMFDYKTEDEIFEDILHLNLKLSLENKKSIYNSYGDQYKEKIKKSYPKCVISGCYIGLNPIKDDWIKNMESYYEKEKMRKENGGKDKDVANKNNVSNEKVQVEIEIEDEDD